MAVGPAGPVAPAGDRTGLTRRSQMPAGDWLEENNGSDAGSTTELAGLPGALPDASEVPLEGAPSRGADPPQEVEDPVAYEGEEPAVAEPRKKLKRTLPDHYYERFKRADRSAPFLLRLLSACVTVAEKSYHPANGRVYCRLHWVFFIIVGMGLGVGALFLLVELAFLGPLDAFKRDLVGASCVLLERNVNDGLPYFDADLTPAASDPNVPPSSPAQIYKDVTSLGMGISVVEPAAEKWLERFDLNSTVDCFYDPGSGTDPLQGVINRNYEVPYDVTALVMMAWTYFAIAVLGWIGVCLCFTGDMSDQDSTCLLIQSGNQEEGHRDPLESTSFADIVLCEPFICCDPTERRDMYRRANAYKSFCCLFLVAGVAGLTYAWSLLFFTSRRYRWSRANNDFESA